MCMGSMTSWMSTRLAVMLWPGVPSVQEGGRAANRSLSWIVTDAVADAEVSSGAVFVVAVPRMIEFLIVTLGAVTFTKPWMSRPSMTAPGVLMVRSPSYLVSVTPAGTPVLAASGTYVPTSRRSGRAEAVGPAQ